MTKRDKMNFKQNMTDNYPEPTDSFGDMVKMRIAEQIGAENAERICVASGNGRRSALRMAGKWVAVAALVLACGTTAIAATSPELINYLSERFHKGDRIVAEDELSGYLTEVTDDAGIAGRVKYTLENGYTEDDIALPLDTPLWRIDSAWCDGVSLYFSATPSAAADKMSGRYHMNPSDHCTVNGKDYMLESSDAEHGAGELSEGEKTGLYHFCVTLDGTDLQTPIEFTFKLYIQEKGKKDITLCASQAISFDINEFRSGVRTVKTDGEILLANGRDKVELLDFRLAPSMLTARVKYTLYGEDARERAELLRGRDVCCPYYIEDSFGARIRGYYPDEEPGAGEVTAEADGGYSVTFWWQTEGVNENTESLTFIPCSVALTEDGKLGQEELLDWAKFTVSTK